MPTHIIFNGREYSSPEAMPADVRNAYQELLDQLQDKNKDGIPDVLQGGGEGRGGAENVLGILQTSVTYNGRTLNDVAGLPASVRRLIENAMGQGNSSVTAPTEVHGNEPLVQSLETTSRAAGGLLGVMLAFLAGFTIMFSVGLMFAIGGGRSHLAGRLYVAIIALLFLGWLDTQATRLARRRESLLGPYSAGYRRFVVWSAVGLLGSAALLLGLAWFLP
jgi:hypothetical protein